MLTKTSAVKSVLRIMSNIKREHTGAFAAQAAFFLIMSFIPLIFLVLTVVGIFGVRTHGIHDFVNAELNAFVPGKLKGVFAGTPFAAVISVVFASWSSGKAFKSITDGLHSVLHISDSRNYLLARIRGLVCSLLFSVVAGILFLFGVLSEYIYTQLSGISSHYARLVSSFFGFNEIFVMMFMFVIFVLAYRFIPDWSTYSKYGRKRVEFRFIAAGAGISTFVVYAYTMLFSYYVGNGVQPPGNAGNLTALAGIMLWLYVSIYIVILGFRLSYYLSTRHTADGK